MWAQLWAADLSRHFPTKKERFILGYKHTCIWRISLKWWSMVVKPQTTPGTNDVYPYPISSLPFWSTYILDVLHSFVLSRYIFVIRHMVVPSNSSTSSLSTMVSSKDWHLPLDKKQFHISSRSRESTFVIRGSLLPPSLKLWTADKCFSYIERSNALYISSSPSFLSFLFMKYPQRIWSRWKNGNSEISLHFLL